MWVEDDEFSETKFHMNPAHIKEKKEHNYPLVGPKLIKRWKNCGHWPMELDASSLKGKPARQAHIQAVGRPPVHDAGARGRPGPDVGGARPDRGRVGRQAHHRPRDPPVERVRGVCAPTRAQRARPPGGVAPRSELDSRGLGVPGRALGGRGPLQPRLHGHGLHQRHRKNTRHLHEREHFLPAQLRCRGARPVPAQPACVFQRQQGARPASAARVARVSQLHPEPPRPETHPEARLVPSATRMAGREFPGHDRLRSKTYEVLRKSVKLPSDHSPPYRCSTPPPSFV